MTSAVQTVRRWEQGVGDWLVGERHAVVALAVCRILTGLSILGLLASNATTRQMWVGDASLWADASRSTSSFFEVAFLDDVSGTVITIFYIVLAVATLAFTIGWHTRAATIVTLLLFVGITGQNPVLGSSSDTIVRLILLWLVLTRCGEEWSVDAAIRRRQDDAVDFGPRWLVTGLHNVGLLGLGCQVGIIYLAAGLDKLASSSWRHGSALYTTVQLPEFRPAPWLSDLITSNRVLLALLTYLVLIVQVYFVPALLHPVTRRIAVLAAVAVNAVFAVLFGTVWTSLAFIAVTMIFVSDYTWDRIGIWIEDLTAPVIDRVLIAYDGLVDRLDALWFDRILPVVDRIVDTVLRR